VDRSTLNVQPVIPFELNPEWNIISRTIVPLIDADAPVAVVTIIPVWAMLCRACLLAQGTNRRGWIWGVGPVFCCRRERQRAGH